MSDPIQDSMLRRAAEHFGAAHADLLTAEAAHRASLETGLYIETTERELRFRRAVVTHLRALLGNGEAPATPATPASPPVTLRAREPEFAEHDLGSIRRILLEIGATESATQQTPTDLLRAVREWRGGPCPPDAKYSAMLDAVEWNLKRLSH